MPCNNTWLKYSFSINLLACAVISVNHDYSFFRRSDRSSQIQICKLFRDVRGKKNKSILFLRGHPFLVPPPYLLKHIFGAGKHGNNLTDIDISIYRSTYNMILDSLNGSLGPNFLFTFNQPFQKCTKHVCCMHG